MTHIHKTLAAIVVPLAVVTSGWTTAIASPQTAVSIVVPKAKRNDAGLALALKDLSEALQRTSKEVSLLYRQPETPLPTGNVIVVGPAKEVSAQPWKPAKAEGLSITAIWTKTSPSTSRTIAI